MDDAPTLRGFLRDVWSVRSGRAQRELAKMGHVRSALIRAVYSPMSDQGAATSIQTVVQSDPSAARATLAYVARIRRNSLQYDTDRALRVLQAAISATPPTPISPDHAALFERERCLGWSPLGAAFHQLATAVPELADIAQAVIEPGNGAGTDLDEFIGPRSSQSDPLLRSSLVATVVQRYLRASRADDHDSLQRPVWFRESTAARTKT